LSDFTKIKGKQLDKIKFALVNPGQNAKPEYIEDGENTASLLLTFTDHYIDDVLFDTTSGRENVALGLEHTNKSRSFWGKTDSIFIR
jgi:ubiquitin carboxyl-terminal hydrolase 7